MYPTTYVGILVAVQHACITFSIVFDRCNFNFLKKVHFRSFDSFTNTHSRMIQDCMRSMKKILNIDFLELDTTLDNDVNHCMWQLTMECIGIFWDQSIITNCYINRRSARMNMKNMESWKLAFLVLFSSNYCYQNSDIITPCSSWIIQELPTRTSISRQVVHSISSSTVTRYSSLTINDEDEDEIEIDDDDDNAKSLFGTKEYWDELYQGRGDFPSDEYQWYVLAALIVSLFLNYILCYVLVLCCFFFSFLWC